MPLKEGFRRLTVDIDNAAYQRLAEVSDLALRSMRAEAAWRLQESLKLTALSKEQEAT